MLPSAKLCLVRLFPLENVGKPRCVLTVALGSVTSEVIFLLVPLGVVRSALLFVKITRLTSCHCGPKRVDPASREPRSGVRDTCAYIHKESYR